MTQPKKSFKLSRKLLSKRNSRRNRNRIKRFSDLLIPLSLFISLICLALIFILINTAHKQIIINPIAIPFSDSKNDTNGNQSELEKMLSEKKIQYLSITKYENTSYKVKLSETSEVIISSQKDIKRQISSLQYILFRLTMEGKQFSLLDLRFDKSVIVLK